MNIHNIIKPTLIAACSIFAFIGGNQAFAANHPSQQAAYAAATKCTSNTYTQMLEYYFLGQDSDGNYRYSKTCHVPNKPYQDKTTYHYFDSLTPSFDSNGEPTSHPAPDISECTATGYTYEWTSSEPFQEKVATDDGCIYEANPDTTIDCYSLPDSSTPEKIYCDIDSATASDTYSPGTDPGEYEQPGIDESEPTQNEQPTQTPEQDFTQDAISDSINAEPIATHQYPDGRKAVTWQSSNGCEVEAIINPGGTYDEITDNCNALDSSNNADPAPEHPDNNTNPDGSSNPDSGFDGNGSVHPDGSGSPGSGDGSGDGSGGDSGDGSGGDSGGDNGDGSGDGDDSVDVPGETPDEDDGTGEGDNQDVIDFLSESTELPQAPEMPVEELDLTEGDSWESGLGAGTCPTTESITFMDQQVDYDITEACNAASNIFKPLLLTLAFITAGFIIPGQRDTW